MAQQKGFLKLAHNLKRLSENVRRNQKITFGVVYTASYAAKVHEDLETPHTNGQAKFLEQPLRQNARLMSQMVKDLVRKQKKTLREALLIVGQWLLEESKRLVPVDTGALRDSGRVVIKRG